MLFRSVPGKWDDVDVCVVDASVNARMVGENNIVGEGFGNGNRYGYGMISELARIMERGGGGGLDYVEDGEPDEDEDVPMSA